MRFRNLIAHSTSKIDLIDIAMALKEHTRSEAAVSYGMTVSMLRTYIEARFAELGPAPAPAAALELDAAHRGLPAAPQIFNPIKRKPNVQTTSISRRR